ncbi:MAG: fibronectin type III domain-containing protein, partial [Candidatus Diapherotrites archaeon]
MLEAKKIFLTVFCLFLYIHIVKTASITSVSINNGKNYTNSRILSVSIVADADEMCFSCNSENWTDWERYSKESTFLIGTSYGCSLEDGIKTVYVKVRDSEGEAIASDSIILDTKAPSIPSNVVATFDGNIVKVSWSASIDASGIEKYVITVREFGKESRVFSRDLYSTETHYDHFALPRRKYCYTILAYDLAGNYSGYSTEYCIATAFAGPSFNLYVLDANMSSRDFNGVSYFHAE